MLYQPTQADVRRFFCSVYAKAVNDTALEAIETIASLWIDEHPEYHADLKDVDAALSNLLSLNQVITTDDGKTSPFLHLSMHLTITEQCSIDQPRGIRQAVELLTARLDSLHDAHHVVMECLGQMIWDAQQNKRAPDGQAYVEAVQRRATKD
jgi:Domain of unknown function (DUF1841)